MSERVISVVPEAGLHARPAAKFVETVNEYEADVRIARADSDDDLVAAASMIAVTSLGVASGDDLRIVTEGEDADEALDALEGVLTASEDELPDL
jgi:phosphocarrier protein